MIGAAAAQTDVRVVLEGLRQDVKPYNIRTTIISCGTVQSELPLSVTEPDMPGASRPAT
jgi:NADP-dependent 3-hydroxy acid dehydrogenase YdfG